MAGYVWLRADPGFYKRDWLARSLQTVIFASTVGNKWRQSAAVWVLLLLCWKQSLDFSETSATARVLRSRKGVGWKGGNVTFLMSFWAVAVGSGGRRYVKSEQTKLKTICTCCFYFMYIFLLFNPLHLLFSLVMFGGQFVQNFAYYYYVRMQEDFANIPLCSRISKSSLLVRRIWRFTILCLIIRVWPLLDDTQ